MRGWKERFWSSWRRQYSRGAVGSGRDGSMPFAFLSCYQLDLPEDRACLHPLAICKAVWIAHCLFLVTSWSDRFSGSERKQFTASRFASVRLPVEPC
eukprot:s3417_g2.t1